MGVYMTQKEVHRMEVVIKVIEKRLTQEEGAQELFISIRQMQRCIKNYKLAGANGLVSKRRGKPSNNRLPEATKCKTLELIMQPLYHDFGPTLMTEKLFQLHNIKISRESTRKLMIECGRWTTDIKKHPVVHQQRQRRPRSGELTQGDGSFHAWFEDRGEPCTLLVFVDDATGRTHAKFHAGETTLGYMQLLAEYIEKYGRPMALYTDKYSVFRCNHGQINENDHFTQFGRALKELDVKLIYAHSPQAKGRVERTNQTLQDRLIKEMRLEGINTIDEGNKFLKKFLEDYNAKFTVAPASTEDAHRPLNPELNLDNILAEKHERVISKNYEFQFENTIYQINKEDVGGWLKKSKIVVVKRRDGTLIFEYNGKIIPVRKYSETISSGQVVDSKEINTFLKTKIERHVSNSHPWKCDKKGYAKIKQRKMQKAA